VRAGATTTTTTRSGGGVEATSRSLIYLTSPSDSAVSTTENLRLKTLDDAQISLRQKRLFAALFFPLLSRLRPHSVAGFA
jgi:hypothetical protein